MGFLAPLYLALGAAAAVPILLHFLRRQTGARVSFPAARYLARAEQEHSRRLRIRHLLLMLLRVIAVLLLAAAAAGPIAAVGGAGHPPVALAVVLDNSLSTTAVSGGAPVFDGLRAATVALLRQGTAADRLWLVTADGQVRGGSAAELARAAAELRPLDGAGNLRGAVERAAALARAAGLASTGVAVATDGQASAWRAAPALGAVGVAALVPASAAPGDRGVASAAARPVRWAPSGTVVARVVGAPVLPDSVAYRIDVGAPGAARRPVARGRVVAGASGDTTAGVLQARVAPSDRGWLTGVVSLAPDEFRGDDSAFFAVSAADPPAVRAAGAASPFIAAAVATLVANGQARPTGPRPVSLGAADAPFALPAVIFAPASPVAVGVANRALDRAGVPWHFGALRPNAARLQAAAGAPAVGDAQATLRYALVSSSATAGAARVLVTAAGEPWAVAGPGYVLVASPPEAPATTLPVLAPWVPWLAGAVASASGGEAVVVAAAPGARVTVPAGTTAIVDLAGVTVAPVRGTSAAAPLVRGVYFFSRGASAASERLGALVVNLESEELVLERVRDEELKRVLSAGARHDALVTRDAGTWSRAAFTGSARRPIAARLVALALLALVVESAAARTGRRRTRLASAA